MPKNSLQLTPKALLGALLLGAAGLTASLDALNQSNLRRKSSAALKHFNSLPLKEQEEEKVQENPPVTIWDSDTQIDHMLDDFLD